LCLKEVEEVKKVKKVEEVKQVKKVEEVEARTLPWTSRNISALGMRMRPRRRI
jgi:hypothetical protein